MPNTLYTALFEENDPVSPFIQVYWAYAEHIGEALEKMKKAALNNGLKKPIWKQLDPYDIDNLPENLKDVSKEEVFWDEDRLFFSPGDAFIFPYGVIPSCAEGIFDPENMVTGYQVSVKPDGLLMLEANLPESRLVPMYLDLLHVFGDFRAFWYMIHEHWEGTEGDDMYLCERLKSAEDICRHLEDNAENSLYNGFCSLTAYVIEGSTNVSLTDHRRIVVFTYAREQLRRATDFFAGQGISDLGNLVTLDERIPHWHFRSPSSLGRRDLIQHLQSSGFALWLIANS